MDNYQGQRQEPYLSTALRLLDNDEYIKWLGTPDCKVWNIMVRNIIRAPMKNRFCNKMYRDYYKKGKLVMAYKLDAIAKKAGLKSRGYLSDIISNMADKEYIIRHSDRWYGRSVVVYELGAHDLGVNRHETLHLHVKMIEKAGEKKLDEFRL